MVESRTTQQIDTQTDLAFFFLAHRMLWERVRTCEEEGEWSLLSEQVTRPEQKQEGRISTPFLTSTGSSSSL